MQNEINYNEEAVKLLKSIDDDKLSKWIYQLIADIVKRYA